MAPCWGSTGWPASRPIAELADLFVDPTVTGRGVGATLLADAAGFSVSMGARRVGSVASSSLVGEELPRFELVMDPAGG